MAFARRGAARCALRATGHTAARGCASGAARGAAAAQAALAPPACASAAAKARAAGAALRRAGVGAGFAASAAAVTAAAGASTAGVALADSAEAAPAARPAAPASLPKMELVLYQYEVCPFCCKVKGYLDARGVPYRTVEVNPLLKSEIKFSKDYRKVPIVLIDGEQFNDSSAIIDEIERRIAAANPAAAKAGGGWFGKTGTSGKAAPAEEVAARRKWVDDHLVHLLPPNIYLTPAEALRSFEYVTEKGNFGTFARYAAKYTGAAAMYAISGKLKKKYGIVNEREELYAAADDFANAVGDDRPFHGGDAPDLADMAVFGVLRAIQLIGADTWQDLQAHSRIGPWFARMQAAAPSARVAAD